MTSFDINLNFADDTAGYWNNFWDNKDGLGSSHIDPDAKNKNLQLLHQKLWSKKLPTGNFMDLKPAVDYNGDNILLWENIRFSSDSLVTGFRYYDCRYIMDELKSKLPNFHNYLEEYIKKSYTIGGMIIFPRHTNSINQHRGCNKLIRDRLDLTIECIRLFYENKQNPLYNILMSDIEFFKLFKNFKGYVDYFLLQDIVSEDYKSVEIYLGSGQFDETPLPQNIDEWFLWHDKTIEFIEKRNKRISEFLKGFPS